MTDITNTDLARLITCVTIHDGVNPYGLHRDTFDRLASCGLVTANYSDGEPDFPEAYKVTPCGRSLVGAMIRTANELIGGMKTQPNPALFKKQPTRIR